MISEFCIRTANSIAGSNFCIPIRKCVHLFTLFIHVNCICKLCSFLHHPNTVKMLSSERTFPKKAGMRTVSQMRSNVKKCPAAEPLCCRALCCHRNLIFKSSASAIWLRQELRTQTKAALDFPVTALQFFSFMGSLTISFQALSMVRITLGPILDRNTSWESSRC